MNDLLYKLSQVRLNDLKTLAHEFDVPSASTKKALIKNLLYHQKGSGKEDTLNYETICHSNEKSEEAVADDEIAYIDPISASPIKKEDLFILGKMCFSKQALQQWISEFKNRSIKPKNPYTNEILEWSVVESLGFNKADFPRTYGLNHSRLTDRIDDQLITLIEWLRRIHRFDIRPEILLDRSWLDLSHKGLTDVPPELGRLSNLQELDLSHNRLTAIPPELGRLRNLLKLDLSHNELTSIPTELGSLSGLKRLILHNNELTSIPPELGSLSALKRLNLSGNEITAIPPELGQLRDLQDLYLNRNRLAVIPPELGNLSALQELDLSHNRLTVIPPELDRLRALQKLDLSGNGLTVISDKIVGNLLINLFYADQPLDGEIYIDIVNQLVPIINRCRNNRITCSQTIIDFFYKDTPTEEGPDDSVIIYLKQGIESILHSIGILT